MTSARNITGDMIVADVLAQSPQTLGLFLEHGFSALRDPDARRTLAKTVTVAQAARLHSVDVDDLLAKLNALQSTLAAAGPAATVNGDGPITANHCPGAIIEQYPHLLTVFLRHGFESLRDENLRRTVASIVTLDTACRMHGVDAHQLLAELNAAR